MRPLGFLTVLSAIALGSSVHAAELSQEQASSENASWDNIAPFTVTVSQWGHTSTVSVYPTPIIAGKPATIGVVVPDKADIARKQTGKAVADAGVFGKVVGWETDEWLPGLCDNEKGNFGWQYTFPKAGTHTFRVRVEDLVVTFPVVVRDAFPSETPTAESSPPAIESSSPEPLSNMSGGAAETSIKSPLKFAYALRVYRPDTPTPKAYRLFRRFAAPGEPNRLTIHATPAIADAGANGD